ncbi:MAG: amidohydrolase [Spirochaetia bacterium]
MNGSLLLRNGVFRTMEPRAPLASAVAIRDGRFLHVGEEAGARAALAGADAVQELDLGGRCVLPGLTDSHLHFMWYAQSLHGVDVETATLAEALERVRARAREAAPGTWITGSGWNHNVWANAAFPDKLSLDQAAPRNPVVLEAKNGHALWVSSAALERAGIGLDTADPPGGKIVHGGDGMPSGVLLDNAMRLVQAVVPRPSVSELAHMMRRAQTEAHRLGLTGIHDFDRTLAFEAFQELHGAGQLSLRVVKGIPHEVLGQAIELGLRSGFGDDMLRLGAVKMFADGALGSQTAWMLAPYEGTWATGIPIMSEEELFEDILRANQAGLACAVHAIGDAACHVVLNAYERAAASLAGGPRLRNRVEHAQLLHRDDVSRFARLSVIASMQPLHATSDMLIAERYWGTRCETAYAWKSLLESGARLAFGSDCPVEIPDPLVGIHAAVTRRRGDGSPGPEGWRPAQRLTVETAVYGYTLGAAYAAGREGELGSIVKGKLADLTIIDRDIFEIPSHDILKTVVDATMVGGELVYRDF